MQDKLSSTVTSVDPLGDNTKPDNGEPWLVTPTDGTELTVTLTTPDKVDLLEFTPQLEQGQQPPDNLDKLTVSLKFKKPSNPAKESYLPENVQKVSSNNAQHNSGSFHHCIIHFKRKLQ